MQYHSFKKTYFLVIGVFFLVLFLHYLGTLNYLENKIRNTFVLALKPITARIQQNKTTDICIDVTSSTISDEIVAKNLDTADQIVILNRGANDGIKIDSPVTSGDGILVGKIIKVEDNISFARVLSDNQSKIAATILNSDHSLGIIEGGFGLSIKMNFIPRNENIITGDQIITSGLELGMPRGLTIGKVAAIENESYQPFQQAVITPAVDYEKINFVGVLITK